MTPTMVRLFQWLAAVVALIVWLGFLYLPSFVVIEPSASESFRNLVFLAGPTAWILLALAADGHKRRVFTPAILSGVLLWTSFFPLNLGPVGFVALVPFLSLIRAEGIGTKRRYFAAFLGGLAFFSMSLGWIRVAHPAMALFAFPGLSLYCSLYFPLALFFLRKLDVAKLPYAITLPIVWVGLEYVRAHFPTGFPFMKPAHAFQLIGFGWYLLGYTQHANLPLLQSADLGGVYLVSAVVAAINGVVYEWALRIRPFQWFIGIPYAWRAPTFHREMVVTAGAALFTLLVAGYGTYRMIHPPFAVGPRVAAIQESIPQNEKMEDTKALFQRYDKLCRNAAHAETKPDLVIWPETCFPMTWYQLGPNADPANAPIEVQEGLLDRAAIGDYGKKNWGTNVLLGLNAVEFDGERMWKSNSSLLVRADGTVEANRYDKMHLVPFGEYVPLKETFPWLQAFTPYKHDYSCRPGDRFERFSIQPLDPKVKKRDLNFGVLICYEDSDPSIAREYNPSSGRNDGVDFLVNMSNDGWFDGTEQHEQHFAICRFRAVESRRTVVRAVNMGISGIIDPDGRVKELPDFEWADSKKKIAIVSGNIPLDSRGSLYAFAGDWVPALCWLLVLGGLGLARRRAVAAFGRPALKGGSTEDNPRERGYPVS